MILITTPNGKVGSEIAKTLLTQGQNVRLGAHSVQKAQTAFPQAEVVPFDFDDEDKVRAALEGVEALYLASPGDAEAAPVNRVIDLAKEAGVGRIVRLSAMGVEHGDNPLHDVEKHLKASGVGYTLLKPNWFMQNYSTLYAESIRTQNTFAEPAGDAKTGFIDARDIAAVGVKALTEAGHHAQAYDLTGARAYTRSEVAEVLSQATGKTVTYEPLTDEAFQAGMTSAGAPAAYVRLMTGLYEGVRAGHTADVTDTVKQVTGRAPISLEQFARDYQDVWL